MRLPRWLSAVCVACAGCGSSSTAAGIDARPPSAAIDAPLATIVPTPIAPPDARVSPRTLTPIAVTPVGDVAGTTVLDVAIDASGAVWATTTTSVMHVAPGGAVRHFGAADGLALGDTTVPFAGIGAGRAGQAFIGTRGRYVDVVDLSAGGLLAVHHVAITNPLHIAHVTMGLRVVVDPGAAYGGTAWIGAEHGTSAIHGIADPAGYCWDRPGCFEEHRHPGPDGNPSGDVKGLAICADHSLWTGDEQWLARMPFGGTGATPDFWALPPLGYPNPLVDLFPGVSDEISSLACDARGVVWAGSWGHGLAAYDPTTTSVRVFDAVNALPEDIVTAVAADGDGSIWVGTSSRGIARYWPATGAWQYYGADAGLPSDTITALAFDTHAATRRLYIASREGLSLYVGE